MTPSLTKPTTPVLEEGGFSEDINRSPLGSSIKSLEDMDTRARESSGTPLRPLTGAARVLLFGPRLGPYTQTTQGLPHQVRDHTPQREKPSRQTIESLGGFLHIIAHDGAFSLPLRADVHEGLICKVVVAILHSLSWIVRSIVNPTNDVHPGR